MNSATYQFHYHEYSVYSNVVGLITEFGARDGVHLDIGCGYGAIAEPVRDLGLTYIGFDADEDSLRDLRSRGFEAKRIDLHRLDEVFAEIAATVNGRNVASISIIDTLEHITNGPALLDRLREFAEQRSILLVVSVPNGGHRDLGAKLLAGHWDYTEVGLLDHTHVIHHTDRLLAAMAKRAGWHEVGARDYELESSDQAFPPAHPLLTGNTAASRYLQQIRRASDAFGTVNELVRAYLPGARHDVPLLADPKEARPFLSIVTRTQAKRLGNLRDVLLCLTAQTCQDFEILVVTHKVDGEPYYAVRRIVEDLPESIRNRARVLRCDRGGRTAPLNDGFAAARGHYVAILDDDELVFAHWVETFKKLSEKAAGCVLRATAAEQDIVSTGVRPDGALGYRTVSAITTPYPAHFDLFEHLSQNYSPPVSLAFPRVAFQELGIRFDESLDTAEDWDFEMRTAFVCGVESSPEITGIYRKWRSGESSFSIHSQDEWRRDYEKIVAKHNDQYHVFPPGTIKLIVDQRNWIKKLEHDIAVLQGAAKLDPLRRFFVRHPRLYRIVRMTYDNSKIVARRIVRRLG
ncbi:methyltransferase domain-containing protein [Burkholderia pseudomallei]|uniref:methyltransferase domain-containing protein n=1 Tax=Burkholderia pseudomallei TaxID=28450 RepID=UPI00016B0E4D|nr:methyltransferase domain-containing protein [Burkholderia pseudomallei]AIV90185.1 glycosyl transferase 2 family protein [Burkholderia pseudomallei B03]AIV95112.1 glycosyl transferase 2 family protein [Burkholderia pseudomallei A79A]AJW54034.1 glycosyl transferase family A [Burkholderia pseudomallei]AJX39038.1 glycosyltransferase like 2 family protein [Burkholderia pseudomallei]ALC56421.1 glycosyl transferase family A [Burkholderia pseudomallei]